MKKKNQHYVPKFYFRFFSKDGCSICVLNRKNGEAYKEAPIKTQASKDQFYGMIEIENAFCEMEGHFSSALKLLRNCDSLNQLSVENSLLILQSVVFQRERTLAIRNSNQPMFNKFARLYWESSIVQDENFSEKEKEDFLTELPDFELDPLKPHLEMIVTALNNSYLLGDLTPFLLENKTKQPFIFGDAPVVFHNAFYGNVKLQGVLGYTTPGLQIFYPLSEKRVLLLIDESKYRVKNSQEGFIGINSLRDVMVINRLQILTAYSSVYFSEYKHANYVKALWRHDCKLLSENLVSVYEGISSDQNGAELGEILHTFSPLLPIKVHLSFLKHAVLGDDQYVFSERSV